MYGIRKCTRVFASPHPGEQAVGLLGAERSVSDALRQRGDHVSGADVTRHLLERRFALSRAQSICLLVGHPAPGDHLVKTLHDPLRPAGISTGGSVLVHTLSIQCVRTKVKTYLCGS